VSCLWRPNTCNLFGQKPFFHTFSVAYTPTVLVVAQHNVDGFHSQRVALSLLGSHRVANSTASVVAVFVLRAVAAGDQDDTRCGARHSRTGDRLERPLSDYYTLSRQRALTTVDYSCIYVYGVVDDEYAWR